MKKSIKEKEKPKNQLSIHDYLMKRIGSLIDNPPKMKDPNAPKPK